MLFDENYPLLIIPCITIFQRVCPHLIWRGYLNFGFFHSERGGVPAGEFDWRKADSQVLWFQNPFSSHLNYAIVIFIRLVARLHVGIYHHQRDHLSVGVWCWINPKLLRNPGKHHWWCACCHLTDGFLKCAFVNNLMSTKTFLYFSFFFFTLISSSFISVSITKSIIFLKVSYESNTFACHCMHGYTWSISVIIALAFSLS